MVQADISIQLRDQRWKSLLRPYCKTVRAACESAIATSKLAKIPCQWEMAVVLADDAFVHDLNHTYRGKDKPTNVLSFPSIEKMESNAKRATKGVNEFELGDVVLAFDTVEREAKEQNKKFKDHAVHLLVHGTLHLLGYDHEKDSEAKIMEKMEVKILKQLGLSNPYL